ncbi:hypothetical protein TRFO_29482 [Tritrichomonas foetus]|uniref:Uncharacterized protein n=1 Tax=Tritrichomonas foetus TaxID=1144522 RepID=A0A1J4JX29_9EUKA|nr:hypothetical protein TRFO_29482 [Tritrichomonas foetus]|eukprot:OHT03226.1 hypothetical protein TRFO_29482 [Tritrichomonas foetus]
MISSLPFSDQAMDYTKPNNEEIIKLRFSELFCQYKRKSQIMYYLRQYSLIKDKNLAKLNLKAPQINLFSWKNIFKQMLTLNPIIYRFRQYNLFLCWNTMIKKQKSLELNFLKILIFRKRLIFEQALKTWKRALKLKNYFKSISIFPNEDLKIRAFRAFMIVRVKKKRDANNLYCARQTRNFILLGNAFDKWRTSLRHKRVTRYLQKRKVDKLKRKFFLLWIKNKRLKARLNYCYEREIEAQKANYKYKAFKIWQDKFFDRKILCKKAHQLIRLLKLKRTRTLFRMWQRNIDYKYFIKESKDRIFYSSKVFTFRKCFFIWKEKYIQNIEMKNRMKKQYTKFIRIKKMIFYKIWRAKYKDINRKREKVNRLHMVYYKPKIQEYFFNYWKEKYQEKHEFLRKWHLATNQWHKSLITPFFKNWHLVSKASIHYQKHLCHITFILFQKYRKHCIHYKRVVRKTIKMYVFLLQRNMFCYWKQYAHEKRESEFIQKHVRISILLDCFVNGSLYNAPSKKTLNSLRSHNKKVSTRDIPSCNANDDNNQLIQELTKELRHVQKEMNENRSDNNLTHKYILLARRINTIQQASSK